jgi:hypothetical protein
MSTFHGGPWRSTRVPAMCASGAACRLDLCELPLPAGCKAMCLTGQARNRTACGTHAPACKRSNGARSAPESCAAARRGCLPVLRRVLPAGNASLACSEAPRGPRPSIAVETRRAVGAVRGNLLAASSVAVPACPCPRAHARVPMPVRPPGPPRRDRPATGLQGMAYQATREPRSSLSW